VSRGTSRSCSGRGCTERRRLGSGCLPFERSLASRLFRPRAGPHGSGLARRHLNRSASCSWMRRLNGRSRTCLRYHRLAGRSFSWAILSSSALRDNTVTASRRCFASTRRGLKARSRRTSTGDGKRATRESKRLPKTAGPGRQANSEALRDRVGADGQRRSEGRLICQWICQWSWEAAGRVFERLGNNWRRERERERERERDSKYPQELSLAGAWPRNRLPAGLWPRPGIRDQRSKARTKLRSPAPSA
jgi:hypothetical protein